MTTTIEEPAKARRGRPAHRDKGEAVAMASRLLSEGYTRHQAAKITALRYSVNFVTVLRWLREQ